MMSEIIGFKAYRVGYCTHRECITRRGGNWKNIEVPAYCFLIHHRKYGYILYDTGYSERLSQITSRMPYCLYAKVTPFYIGKDESLRAQLSQDGISEDMINYIIISHFHADHISGVSDFSKAKLLCLESCYADVKNTKKLQTVVKGFFPDLLPKDLQSRLSFVDETRVFNIPDQLRAFQEGYDIFEDGSLIGIELPGHATGQLGLYFRLSEGKAIFLVADSAWSSKAIHDFDLPWQITRLIHSDWQAYKKTLKTLHDIYHQHSDITLLPSHCPLVAEYT